jgi:hypothetical protein
MTPPSPATTERSRWPLRVALGLALSVLIVVGDRALPRNHSSALVTTTLFGSTTTAPDSPPTTAATHALAPDHPIVNPGSLDQRARGCGFHVTPSSTTTNSTITTAKRVVGLGHCTILEIGDSLGNDLGWGLARELDPTSGLRLVQLDKSSSGLAAGWFYNWHHHLAADLGRYHPNLVIICLGANDEQAIAVKGVSQAFGSASWAAAYQPRVRELVTLAVKSGSYVLWVGLPIVQPPHYRSGVNFLNLQYREVVTKIPGATFQPTWRLLADAQGRFRAGARVNGVEAAIRASDGIHFTVYGEDVFSTFVAHQITSIYHVPLRLHAPMIING